MVLVVLVLVNQETGALLQRFFHTLLNDGVMTDFVHLSIRSVFVITDFIRLTSHIVSFSLVACSPVSKIGEEEVFVLQEAKLTRYLVLKAVGRRGLVLAWISTQRLLVSNSVTCRLK